MKKVNIEMSVEQYKNVHLMLHNLIELSGVLLNDNEGNEALEAMNTGLKSIKTLLEDK